MEILNGTMVLCGNLRKILRACRNKIFGRISAKLNTILLHTHVFLALHFYATHHSILLMKTKIISKILFLFTVELLRFYISRVMSLVVKVVLNNLRVSILVCSSVSALMLVLVCTVLYR